MENIRVIFMGTPQFACSILQSLIDEKYQVVAVVSQPDKKVGRKQIVQETPVKQLAKQYDLPVLQPDNIKEEYADVLAYKPDLIVTCAYGQFIPKCILDYPQYGCINVHASLLPKLRGGAPIHKAIINGDKVTGITIMQMIPKMDAGLMYAKKEVVIEEDDTTSILHDKLMAAGSQLLKTMLPDYLAHKIVGIPQDEAEATFAYNIAKEEEFISFKEDVHKVYDHIRGLIDWPVGYGMIDGQRLKIYQACKIVTNHQVELGKAKMQDDMIMVACKNGYIGLKEVQLAGKKKMLAKDFYNGNKELITNNIFD
ncbi:MAG: methionyl-tRNA formyltransferase [Erysipelotrichaceae bacterium]|nr:methionyl-tRNA formyltransferase [Erysipelotrichaceae bacterium]